MKVFTVQRSFYNATQDSGFWSPSTSGANFCEEEYIVTYYIAELINTLSNLAYVYYALYPPATLDDCLPWPRKRTNTGQTPTFNNVPAIDLSAIALILVGISSASFHMTMRALPQFFDESSMYLLAASWIYALMTTKYVRTASPKQDFKDKPIERYRVVRHNQVLVSMALTAALLLASTSTIWTGHLAIHSVMFGILLVISGIKLLYLIKLATSSIKTSEGSNANILQERNPKARRTLLSSLFKAIAFLVLAFTLWLLDTNPQVCAHLRYVRNEVLDRSFVLRPIAFLTELHGWWHILTARAAGEYLALVRFLTTETRR